MAKRSKLNPRQEKFVREYVKTGVARKAYQQAGFKSAKPAAVDANASRLISSDKVKQAIVSLQMRAKTRHDYTIDSILNDLEEDRRAAYAFEQAGAAVTATTTKAKLLGMIVERKESGAPGEFAALDSVQAILAAATKELGQDAARALAALVGAPLTIDASAQDVSATPDVVASRDDR